MRVELERLDDNDGGSVEVEPTDDEELDEV